MKRPIIVVLALTLLFGSLSATDLTITFTSKGKSVMGGGGDGTVIHYYTAAYQMARMVEARHDDLVDIQQGISYVIDHKKKTVSKISFDDAAAAMANLDTSNGAALGKLMTAMVGDPNAVQVARTGSEQVTGRNCQVWHIQVGKLVMDLSADPTLKRPIPDRDLARITQARIAQFARSGPMGASFKRMFEEMAKIQGIPLKTHMTGIMGMDATQEATRVEVGAIPADTFALPEGYKVQDMGKQLREAAAKANP